MTSYSTTQTRAEPGASISRRLGSRLVESAMLLAFLAIDFAVAALGVVATQGAVDGWYARAAHVPWTPPNAVFGVVWSVLYVLIAVAGWLVWRQRWRVGVGPALTFFVAQLVLNAVWTPIFFGGYALIGGTALWVGFVVILVIDLAVAATISAFWPISRTAAVLLLPYLAWLIYATTLNWGDAAMNALG